MQYYQGSLAVAAQAAVRTIWHLRVDFSQLPDGLAILPDGFAELVFHFGGACWYATGAEELLLPSPALIGLLEQPVQLRGNGPVEFIGLKCFPWVVPDLPGLPLQPVGIYGVAAPFAQLHASLAALVAAGQVEAALAHVSSYLAQLPLPTNRVLAQAGQAMRTAQGTLPISQVAAVAHTTARTLERQFQQAVGVTAKELSRLIRFEQVRQHLLRHPAASLPNLAQEFGYTDQSHLGREFKRYSGSSPAAFARQARQTQ